MKHLALLAILLLTTGCQQFTAPQGGIAKVAAEDSAQEGLAKDQDERPYYRYSVVSGGVYSKKEALERIAKDPVVREHYGPIEAERLSPRINDRDRDVYVSYRVGPNVYWTTKPVRIKKNELVLTDGVNEVRTRCGNRIAEAPQGPVNAAVEPQPDVFDTKVQKADAGFPAAVNAGLATPMGGVYLPGFGQTVTALPAPHPSPAPGPVTVAGGSGGGLVRGGGGGGMGGGGGGAGVVAVAPDNATGPGYYYNPYANPVILVLQTGSPGTYVSNQGSPVYNYYSNLTAPGSLPGVDSVVYSQTFNGASFPTPALIWNGGTAFGGLAPIPVTYSPGGPSVSSGGTAVGSGPGTPGVPNNVGSPGNSGSPSSPGSSGNPDTPRTPDTPGTPGGPGPTTAVPEPGTLGMTVIATLIAAWLRRRREKS